MKALKRILRSLFHPLATRFGYQRIATGPGTSGAAHEHHKDTLLRTFYSVLRNAGFEPKHIVDVGANHGSWTRVALTMFPQAQFTMLEPQAWLQPSFQDLLDSNPLIRYFPIGAGKNNGTFLLTIAKRDDSSTFRLTTEEAETSGLVQKEIPVETLNALVATNALPIPDMVKIDAEGMDLDVLEGACDFFGLTEVFMVEAAITNKSFRNTALEVIRYMDGKGYRLFDLTDLNRPWSSKVLWLVEMAFVRKGGKLDSIVWN
ncbi:MAG: FkbM family methyltransferase [Flavobacteriales bacterium]|nr:FkbM family methyltransferase [Flavobacteriales bacterium]